MADAPRKRRWPWVLAALVLLAGAAALWIDRQLEPERLTATVLARAGAALGLEFSIDGRPEYALRPEPRLVLPGLKVRQPGAAAPWILRARRAEVSLPWDTITGGNAVVITRLELDDPELDLAALSSWLASRPPSEAPFELPGFTDGIAITGGRVLGDGWEVVGLSLTLPTLAPGAPADADLTGRFVMDATAVEFAARLQAANAGLDTPLVLDGRGRLRSGELDAPWSLALSGRLDAAGEPLSLVIDTLAWRSAPPLPDFDAAGRVQYAGTLALELEGTLPRWPDGWPALPEPLASSESTFAFALDYAGAADASAPLGLQLRRDETVLATTLVVPELLAWLDADTTTPLPPLSGQLQTPRLDVGGATLEGIRITLDPPVGGASAPMPSVGGTSVPTAEAIGTEVPPTESAGADAPATDSGDD